MSENELNANQQSAVPTRQKYDLKWNINKVTTRLPPTVLIQLGHYMKQYDLRPNEAVKKILSDYLTKKNYPTTSD